MSDLQRAVRKEVCRAEQFAQISLEWVEIFREIGWELMVEKYLRDYNHFNGRRSYFLKELQSIQIREFRRG